MAEHPEDLDLAKRLAAGEQSLFSGFFETYFPRLFRFALVRLRGDFDAAEEITQRTLCKAVRKLDLYRGEASLLTWLCQICRREIADFAAARQHELARYVAVDDDPDVRAAVESIPAGDAFDPMEHVARRDRGRLVQIVLDHLPARYGDVLEWKYVEGLAVDEIAERLTVSSHAAESMLARARRAFREAWRGLAGEWLLDAEGDSAKERLL